MTHTPEVQPGGVRPDEAMTAEAEGASLRPAIWLGSLTDYYRGIVYGGWLDATQTPEELRVAIDQMLARSPTPGANRWAVFHQRNFYGLEIGRTDSLETISRIANGLVEHGEPYAHWAEYVGQDLERLERFAEHYLGHFAAIDTYIEHVVAETVRWSNVDRLPLSVQLHARFTIRSSAERWAKELFTAPASEGGYHLFAP